MSANAASDAPSFEDIVTGEIRAEIARQRLNNRKVAALMGRSNFWVGDRLNGRCHIEVQDLAEFADALGVSVIQFVRHQGLEPRTRWFGVSPCQRNDTSTADVINFPPRPASDDREDGPIAPVVDITHRSRVSNEPSRYTRPTPTATSVPVHGLRAEQ